MCPELLFISFGSYRIKMPLVLCGLNILNSFSLGFGHGMAMPLHYSGTRICRGMARRAQNPNQCVE
jgi:hypothetical protein